ncbi:hypothetical protein [Halosegnis sp.]|uniref:hypothetical protein n=1 Tax=Halosegnis sp. TaxID=2864959 RepID=UPI0035D48B7C
MGPLGEAQETTGDIDPLAAGDTALLLSAAMQRPPIPACTPLPDTLEAANVLAVSLDGAPQETVRAWR